MKSVGEQKRSNVHASAGVEKTDFVRARNERDKTLGMPKLIIPSLQVNMRAGDLPERALIRSQVELIKADADAARSGVDAETSRLLMQGQMGIAHPDSALALAGSLEYQEIQFDEGDAVLRGSSERRPDVMAAG